MTGRNIKATSAFVVGLVSFVVPLLGLVAIGLGLAGYGEVRRSGQPGANFAVAGVALGVASLALLGLVLFDVVVLPTE